MRFALVVVGVAFGAFAAAAAATAPHQADECGHGGVVPVAAAAAFAVAVPFAALLSARVLRVLALVALGAAILYGMAWTGLDLDYGNEFVEHGCTYGSAMADEDAGGCAVLAVAACWSTVAGARMIRNRRRAR